MILEKVVRFQVEQFMEDNNLYAKDQYGFRSNKSTISALSAVHSQCLRNADAENSTVMALYDLSAAFDCLDSSILCDKLEKFGFEDTSLRWMKSSLSGRSDRK